MKKVIATTKAPAALGPYSQAVLVDSTLYGSGQVGIDPASGKLVGAALKPKPNKFWRISAKF